ncbi:hypothetical protein H0H93_011772 [Arthromyces matolae]|nr:hypothetical protein H0H93_011772 [Arthromyces matolae]
MPIERDLHADTSAAQSLARSCSTKRKQSPDSVTTGTADAAPEDYFKEEIRAAGKKTAHAVWGATEGSSAREDSDELVVTEYGKRDKGKCVDRSARPSLVKRSEPPTTLDPASSDRHAFLGPMAQAEFENLKREVDIYKKAANDGKRQMKKQAKKIDELKAQIVSETLEWFRKAPPADDDSIDPDEFEDDESYLLERPKFCPCCRAEVTRPIPAFLVKSITSVLSKYRAALRSEELLRTKSPSPTCEDPWKGLFYEHTDGAGDSAEASDDDEAYHDAFQHALEAFQIGFRGEIQRQLQAFEDADEESQSGSEFYVNEGLETEDEDAAPEGDDDRDRDSVDSYGTDEYENVYVPARWEPPNVSVDDTRVFDNEGAAASMLPMLRRGCTVGMIRLFEVFYSHNRGLVAHLHSLDMNEDVTRLDQLSIPRNNRLFLGWNIRMDPEDYTGEGYIHRVLNDMKEYPEQWMWTERAHHPGAFDVKLLVKIEDVEQYETTDTEDWLAFNEPYE